MYVHVGDTLTRISDQFPGGSADDAICEGISPLGYWQKVNQSPTQTNPYSISTSVLSLIHI